MYRKRYVLSYKKHNASTDTYKLIQNTIIDMEIPRIEPPCNSRGDSKGRMSLNPESRRGMFLRLANGTIFGAIEIKV